MLFLPSRQPLVSIHYIVPLLQICFGFKLEFYVIYLPYLENITVFFNTGNQDSIFSNKTNLKNIPLWCKNELALNELA